MAADIIRSKNRQHNYTETEVNTPTKICDDAVLSSSLIICIEVKAYGLSDFRAFASDIGNTASQVKYHGIGGPLICICHGAIASGGNSVFFITEKTEFIIIKIKDSDNIGNNIVGNSEMSADNADRSGSLRFI